MKIIMWSTLSFGIVAMLFAQNYMFDMRVPSPLPLNNYRDEARENGNAPKDMKDNKSEDWDPFKDSGLPFAKILEISKQAAELQNPDYVIANVIELSLGRRVLKGDDADSQLLGRYCWKFRCIMTHKDHENLINTFEISLWPDGSNVDDHDRGK